MTIDLPLLLAIAGCVALLVGLFGGGVKAKEVVIPKISRLPRIFSSFVGLILIGTATWLYIWKISPLPNVIEQPTAITNTVAPTPSPTQLSTPRIYDFAACLLPCDGSNSLATFPPKTTNIYVAWKYENIPAGAHFVRTWKVIEKNQIWVSYDCTWTDPPTGNKIVSLYDVKGLTSGTWELTIFINEIVLLQQRIYIQGNWNYWAPAGTRHTCS